MIDADWIAAVHREVLDEIADAITFAEDSPFPTSPTLTDDVYSNPIVRDAAHDRD